MLIFKNLVLYDTLVSFWMHVFFVVLVFILCCSLLCALFSVLSSKNQNFYELYVFALSHVNSTNLSLHF